MGTSLRGQRIWLKTSEVTARRRDISACAQRNTIVGGSRKSDNGTSLRSEDTSRPWRPPTGSPEHLCACRGHTSTNVTVRGLTGTSPELGSNCAVATSGNISAHAEDTSRALTQSSTAAEHLCVRRETWPAAHHGSYHLGTSLRAQRNLDGDDPGFLLLRNISACAEKPTCFASASSICREHLCVRRETGSQSIAVRVGTGTSLHAERNPERPRPRAADRGNISACAEKPTAVTGLVPSAAEHLCVRRETSP